MDEAAGRGYIAAHARTLQAGDLTGAAACLDEDLGARWEAVLAQLPQRIRSVELAQLERVSGAIVAPVRYSDDAVETTVQQRWEVRARPPMIVQARVVPTRLGGAS
jgi:hypothetical protein